MLRALWFFFQLAIVVAAAIWISAQQGAVDIVWGDYAVSLHLGIFLLFLTLFTIVAVAFFRLFGAIVGAPGALSRRRREKNRQKGFQALTRGFVAIAANDARKATSCARDVRKLMPEENGLPLLLEAQAARMRGEETAARQSFEKLLDDKDAAFFGIRGLLKSSMETGDSLAALRFARAALEKNPKQPWVLKSVYELELQNHHWDAALAILDRVRKYGGIEEDKARKDEVALLLILAGEHRIAHDEAGEMKKIERAVKLDPSFAPAALRLAEHYLDKGKNGKAAGVVEKAWKLNPHPDLIVFWDRLAPAPLASDPLRRMRWFEKLTAIRPDSADGQLAVARAAMESGLNGEARSSLLIVESLRPTVQLYRLRADLEENTTRNATMVREWLDKAASAAPDAVWYCTMTGHIYESWSPVARPHGSFNTIEWGSPFVARTDAMIGSQRTKAWKDPLMIENA